jgi:hypothetical protein
VYWLAAAWPKARRRPSVAALGVQPARGSPASLSSSGDGQVRFGGFAFVVIDQARLQVVRGHAEGLLEAPQLVVGADDELRALADQVGVYPSRPASARVLASEARLTLLVAPVAGCSRVQQDGQGTGVSLAIRSSPSDASCVVVPTGSQGGSRSGPMTDWSPGIHPAAVSGRSTDSSSGWNSNAFDLLALLSPARRSAFLVVGAIDGDGGIDIRVQPAVTVGARLLRKGSHPPWSMGCRSHRAVKFVEMADRHPAGPIRS